MSKVLAIYPIDKSNSTKFLNRINTFEKRELGDKWHCFKIHLSDEDHVKCLTEISKVRFIIFMGHGGEARLCGACGKYGEESVDDFVKLENDDYYNNANFITAENIGRFKDRVLCCFSCNSNRNSTKSLSRIAIKEGVISFIGFGDIPTDYIDGVTFSKRCISIFKGIITKIMKHSFKIAIQDNNTVDCFVQTIRLLTTKEIQYLMNSKYKIRHKTQIIHQLVLFKNEIRIFGNPYARLVEE